MLGPLVLMVGAPGLELVKQICDISRDDEKIRRRRICVVSKEFEHLYSYPGSSQRRDRDSSKP